MAIGPYASDGSLNTRQWEYPADSTPIIVTSGNIANNTAAATMAAVAGKTNYITDFAVTGAGATAALAVTVAVQGLIGGVDINFTYSFAAGVAVANQPLIVNFPYPVPASAVNTAITVTCPAGGSGAAKNTVSVFGYVR